LVEALAQGHLAADFEFDPLNSRLGLQRRRGRREEDEVWESG
jgi:hypothetical protein